MRDARINTIGEGANEVLLAFIAVVGMRDAGLGLKSTLEGLMRPLSFLPSLWSFSREHMGRLVRSPTVPVATPMLRPLADSLARKVARFARSVERVLMKHREAVLMRQLVLERIADAAIALVTASCTLARLDSQLVGNRPLSATARPRNFTCAWLFAAATSHCGLSTTTTTVQPWPPLMPPCGGSLDSLWDKIPILS